MYDTDKRDTLFAKWLIKLKDNKAKVAIFRRLNRVRNGNFGDYKSLGDGLYELRAHLKTLDTHNITSFVLDKAHFTDLAVAKSKKCNAV